LRWPKKNSTHCPGWVDHYMRRWVSGSVLPCLRSQSRPHATPQRAMLRWKTAEIDTLHWQGKTWIPLSDCPHFLDSPRPLIRA
ncbi:hypothetical protein DZ922_006600, partial [Pseudomonas aeruginosa]|nr:hypothetical protein [Pseudomonas paraeruginosa]